jgi:hypothetical protein
MGGNHRSGAGLVVLNTDRQVAAYASAPYGGQREAPPAALYLGRLAPNTRGPAATGLGRVGESGVARLVGRM